MTLYRSNYPNRPRSYFDPKKIIYKGLYNESDGSFRLSGTGALKLLTASKNLILSEKITRGAKVNIFESKCSAHYTVYDDDTFDIDITVTIRAANNLSGYILSYILQKIDPPSTKRVLLINPAIPKSEYKDYSIGPPILITQGYNVLKRFQLKSEKLGNQTELFINILLPTGNSSEGHSFVATQHIIKIKKT